MTKCYGEHVPTHATQSKLVVTDFEFFGLTLRRGSWNITTQRAVNVAHSCSISKWWKHYKKASKLSDISSENTYLDYFSIGWDSSLNYLVKWEFINMFFILIEVKLNRWFDAVLFFSFECHCVSKKIPEMAHLTFLIKKYNSA